MSSTFFSFLLRANHCFIAVLVLISLSACSSQSSDGSTIQPSENASPSINTTEQENTMPAFISKMLADVKNMPAHEQPLAITRYEYNGEQVYLVTPPCCDFFSKLYDSDGNVLGSPSGGLTGKGDGSLPNFESSKTKAYGIWKKGK